MNSYYKQHIKSMSTTFVLRMMFWVIVGLTPQMYSDKLAKLSTVTDSDISVYTVSNFRTHCGRYNNR